MPSVGTVVKRRNSKGDHVNRCELISTFLARIGGIAYVQYHKRIARALGSRMQENGEEKEEYVEKVVLEYTHTA